MSCKKIDSLSLEPFYNHPCSEVLEDHARHVVVHQYTTCIKVANEWAIPDSNTLIWLYVPAVVDFLVGAYIWNPDYGVFVITAFDKQAQKIRVTRVGNGLGFEATGTVVPACSKFIITMYIGAFAD